MYAKPMALYQYIPPNSCHPPGVLKGLVFCIGTNSSSLPTLHQDRRHWSGITFLSRLTCRPGLSTRCIIPYLRARSCNMDERLFFVLPHQIPPQNVPLKVTQQLWRNSISSPPGKKTLTQLKNCSGIYIQIKRLIVSCIPSCSKLQTLATYSHIVSYLLVQGWKLHCSSKQCRKYARKSCKLVKNTRKYFVWSCCLVQDFHIQIILYWFLLGEFVGVVMTLRDWRFKPSTIEFLFLHASWVWKSSLVDHIIPLSRTIETHHLCPINQ